MIGSQHWPPLVHRKVDVIMTGGGPPAALAAKAATSTIPIVFVVGTDPVELGLVSSLARPGGNLTGMSMLMTELNPKRVELLSELVPQARAIGLLVNPEYSGTPEMIREVQEAARAKDLQLHIAKARSEAEIDAAFASFIQQASRRGAPKGSWLAQMLARKPKMLVTVALANKIARIIWALLVKGGTYKTPTAAA